MLQKTEKLSEVLFRERIEAFFLKDLPIIVSFDSFGSEAVQREDKEMLDIIEKKIKKEKAPFTINVETVTKFLRKLECDTLIMITGRNIGEDFWDSGELQHIKSINNVFEVSIEGEVKAFIYWSYFFWKKNSNIC